MAIPNAGIITTGKEYMTVLLNGIRSILFNLAFYLFTIVFAAFYLVPLCWLANDDTVRSGILRYCHGVLFLARVVMGIKYELRSTQIVPKEGALMLVAAHQSYMDPILTFLVRRDITALAKKELFSLPLIGTILKTVKIVRIDRESRTAHKGMQEVGHQVQKMQCPLIVYPQATRVPIGQRRKLKSGAYYLHADAGLPVYTVATNTGLFWGKGFWHRSGTAVFEVVEKLPEGLGKGEFMQRLEADVVQRSDKLVEEAGYAALLPAPTES